MDQVINIILIVVLTVISGFSDAQGVLHAANIWQDGNLVPLELAKSALGFAGGISMYWIALRFMKAVGIVAPELQTVIWFTIMMVGVAVLSGTFFKWRLPEQAVAMVVIAGILWLSVRAGG
ncbi:MAG TPA: hypothetical protein VHL11_15400 [Phototrophicaceae bacterium]|jgi:hypothetical protein|nr:hypothetical protein [Phototrophicaceae bacterium]